jgi:hypothetical protein
MRKLSLLILIGALIMFMPSVASALGLSVSAQIPSGQSLGDAVLLDCKGYKVGLDSTKFNPWAAGNCTNLGKSSTSLPLNFGTLITTLKDSTGAVTGGAGCFYGEDFFIVYLYPDAYGGAGYQLSQSSTTLPSVLTNTMLFTPVYSAEDRYDVNGDGDTLDPGEDPQGALNATEQTLNPQVYPNAVSKFASAGGLILKAYRPRIVRAQYGIPPIQAGGAPWITNWVPIPLTTTATTYNISITISLTPI